jgi:hypothetical protein
LPASAKEAIVSDLDAKAACSVNAMLRAVGRSWNTALRFAY